MPKKTHRLETTAILAVFVAIIGLVWLDEAVDLPALLFSAPPEPSGRTAECLIQSLQFTLLGGGLLWYIQRLKQRIRELESYIVMCSWCNRINIEDDRWVSIEHYLRRQRDLQTSHGICPDCAQRLHAEHQQACLESDAI
ncbi:MAG: hypothetical protein BWY87_00302 [Deltaproteobacteria bacterium ADurb.Bin510]|nr:MAG: hypothetical protein BWY87_00302 [Deltaproteobacteria bacterium ADurb.Bin510]